MADASDGREALAITRRIDHGPAASRAAAQAELNSRFPCVFPWTGGGWEIRGIGFGSVPVVREPADSQYRSGTPGGDRAVKAGHLAILLADLLLPLAIGSGCRSRNEVNMHPDRPGPRAPLPAKAPNGPFAVSWRVPSPAPWKPRLPSADGLVVVPSARPGSVANEGAVQAFDAKSGALQWTFDAPGTRAEWRRRPSSRMTGCFRHFRGSGPRGRMGERKAQMASSARKRRDRRDRRPECHRSRRRRGPRDSRARGSLGQADLGALRRKARLRAADRRRV